MSDAFQVGDKVLCDNSRIGVITKITQKKKNITVDYGKIYGNL